MKDLGCFYHVTFATKYRRKSFLDYQKQVIAKQFDDTCKKNGATLVSCVVEEDHVHLLFQIPATLPIPYLLNRIKSDSARVYNRHFQKLGQRVWQTSYSIATVSSLNFRQLQAYFTHHEKSSIFEFSNISEG